VNWLAHVFLSEPNVEFRLGNLLADLVRGDARAAVSAEFARGAQQHKRIDAYTDAHPIVRRSRARIRTEYRRFSGVLMDVFYDYFLANEWSRYSNVTLDDFTSRFYADVRGSSLILPSDAAATMDRITRHDLLGSYREVAGVERSLRRVSIYLSQKWRRDFALDKSVEDLIAHEAALAADFAEFFPQLEAHVRLPLS
jgi:acyl carrier protein phosphodiesterase